MSRITFIVALSISCVLILGAAFWRFARIPPYHRNELVSVEQNADEFSDEIFLSDIVNATSSTQETPRPLTQTETIGRQLFANYIQLASNGKDNTDVLNTIAEEYAESLLSQNLSVEVAANQIQTLPDSKENFLLYAKRLSAIQNKNKLLAEKSHSESGAVNDIESRSFQTFLDKVKELYRSSAQELISIPVPQSLADNHRKLIGNYFSSALAIEKLSDVNKDPLIAYAAINIQARNAEEETRLFSNIQAVVDTSLMLNTTR